MRVRYPEATPTGFELDALGRGCLGDFFHASQLAPDSVVSSFHVWSKRLDRTSLERISVDELRGNQECEVEQDTCLDSMIYVPP